MIAAAERSKWRWPILRCLPLAAATILLAPQLHAQQYVVTPDPLQTTIDYTLGATLHTVHGTFKLKRGEVRFDATAGKASGLFVVDATSGDSGNKGRDWRMHRDVLESQKFPEITFTPQQVHGTFNLHAVSQLQVIGVFRLHGQDRTLTVTISVLPSNGTQIEATAHFVVPYVQWGLKDPSHFLLHVNDTVEMDVHMLAQCVPSPVIGTRH